MKFKNPNVNLLMKTNKRLLATPNEMILNNCRDDSKKFDLDYLAWLIANGQEEQFYKTMIWRKTRPLVIERDKYECQLCKYHRNLTVVRKRAYVHHIAEFKLFPDYCLNFNNLVTLCHTCHELTHERTWITPTKEIDTFENFDAVERW